MKQARKPRTSRNDNIDKAAPASVVIDKFGGMGRFCDLAGEHTDLFPGGCPTSTAWGWIVRGNIPHGRVPHIKALALRAKPIVRLKDADFIRQTPAV